MAYYKETGNLTINANDEFGLSQDNVYKYSLSSSQLDIPTEGWTDYTLGETFSVSGTNETKYLWVYPVKDKV